MYNLLLKVLSIFANVNVDVDDAFLEHLTFFSKGSVVFAIDAIASEKPDLEKLSFLKTVARVGELMHWSTTWECLD